MKKSPSAVGSMTFSGTSPTRDTGITQLLEGLSSPDAQPAWEVFLLQYSAILYQSVQASMQDADEIADCFVYACEQLAKDDFRRLLRFKPDGAASFTTWLRVVARNLCFDWQRKVHGRPRPFKSVQGLSALELAAYHSRYERRLSRDETLEGLRANWPATKMDDLIEMENRIENFLNPLQRWILNTRQQGRVEITSWSDSEDSEPVTAELIDPAPNPEAIVLDDQQRTTLHECLAVLSDEERLVVRLRFDEELSLKEISRLIGLGDPQRVHRLLSAILHKLHEAMGNMRERKTGDHVREIREKRK